MFVCGRLSVWPVFVRVCVCAKKRGHVYVVRRGGLLLLVQEQSQVEA